MNLVKRIDTVFVPVTDLKKSEAWYMEVFSFEEAVFRSSDGNYVGFRFEGHGEPKTALTLYKADEVPTLKHMAFNFYTEDVDALHTKLKETGVEVTEIHAGDGMRFFEFVDPDGNELGAVTF
ncbi:VOC family protein [Chengkuizengella axinellae]|uniref:VOC family protein n=1 Tax=Chengkuizengella axinellae TaxID=3064388 RepID=A0ABT9IWW9_9BACL|nr:VOC family protein [Chengkuizengella sp. 2205SS18-9]MDP5273864.1 VOC family protein [Chengkuizengella sp. 2205SS18-9]